MHNICILLKYNNKLGKMSILISYPVLEFSCFLKVKVLFNCLVLCTKAFGHINSGVGLCLLVSVHKSMVGCVWCGRMCVVHK